MIKTWRNGAKGSEVKSIIDYNFNFVSKYLTKNIKALSTQERNLLSADYLKEGTLVFDTDEEQWYKYFKGSWVRISVDDTTCTYNISANDWINNSITILFEEHGIQNPIVQLFVKIENSFIPASGGVEVDSAYNIILSTDLPFDGRVIIK